ncbi:uncharacterized protein LOC118741242 [Rhagoletis pomonella]|uniref:uncharacterized protein LOC118741242 n=1 Tax=Rhagoletis pomonella TaxID=28610 RepID=UPI001786531E|nr:uncharacterized protein LOC118741242 [Rhagoletis pomonella]
MPKPKKNLSRKSRGARAMARKRRMIFAAREEAINQLNYTATKEQLRELKSKLAERKYYFTDQQTQVLLQTICDTVKDQPACFEVNTPFHEYWRGPKVRFFRILICNRKIMVHYAIKQSV